MTFDHSTAHRRFEFSRQYWQRHMPATSPHQHARICAHTGTCTCSHACT
jgi:hypothetical protein